MRVSGRWISIVTLCVTVIALAIPLTVQAQNPIAGDIGIVYFETITRAAIAAQGAALKPSSGGFSFDAYGRRFDLLLETNDRIAPVGKPQWLHLWRGTLRNAPDSWVRLASTDDGTLQGMIWDGSQLYLIEPATAVRDSLVPPLQAANGEMLIFRLADTVIGPGILAFDTGAITAAQSDNATGQDAYDNLTRELRTEITKGGTVALQAIGASRRLEMSIVGDAAFRDQYASDDEARAQIVSRMNAVDGIYSHELGVAIQATLIKVNPEATQRLSTTTVPLDLLASLAELRRDTPDLSAKGLTHLFTGRDLDNNTVGLAYRDVLCSTSSGAGLTEARNRGSVFDALIAAHEIGHNFGAVHDGEVPTSVGEPDCRTTPTNQYLMSANIHVERNTFSQCSLNTIRPRITAASCITALPPANLSVAADLGTLHKGLSRTFDLVIPVTNSGGVTATNPHAQILVPPSVLVDNAVVPGGSCTSLAGVINCTMDPIDGGARTDVTLTLKSDVIGSNSFSIQVASDSDSQSANNSGDGTIIIEPEANLRIALEAPDSALTGASFAATFTVTNLLSSAVAEVDVELEIPATAQFSEASLDGLPCQAVLATLLRCSMDSLAADSSAGGMVRLNAPVTGELLVRATATGAYVDVDDTDNVAEQTVAVSDTPGQASPSIVSRHHGGIGTFDAFLLLPFGLLAIARRRFGKSLLASSTLIRIDPDQSPRLMASTRASAGNESLK